MGTSRMWPYPLSFLHLFLIISISICPFYTNWQIEKLISCSLDKTGLFEGQHDESAWKMANNGTGEYQIQYKIYPKIYPKNLWTDYRRTDQLCDVVWWKSILNVILSHPPFTPHIFPSHMGHLCTLSAHFRKSMLLTAHTCRLCCRQQNLVITIGQRVVLSTRISEFWCMREISWMEE